MTKKVIILSIVLSIALFSVALAVVAPTHPATAFDFQPQDIFRLYYGSTRALSFGGACYVNGNDLGALLFNPAEVMTMPDGNLGISGITANGALEAQYAEATITSREATGEKAIETFTLVPTDSIVFYPTFAGIKLGSLAIMYSKPYFIPVYRRFDTDQTITAPDGYSISYNQFAFYDNFSDFNIYSAVLGVGNKILTGGIRASYFNGPRVRYVRGISSDNEDYWYRKESINYNGYTVDAGAMINLFILKAGVVYKNAASNINYTKTGEWADTYDGGYYSQDSTTTGTLINAPYIVGSVGVGTKNLKAEISAYDLDPQALQEGTISAAGIAVGGEASISILQVRVGARMPYGKFMDFVDDPNQVALILSDPGVHLSFGIGASLGPIQADVAFGKNVLMKTLNDGDLGNYWSINTGINFLF